MTQATKIFMTDAQGMRWVNADYVKEVADDIADFGGNHAIDGNDLDIKRDSIWRIFRVRAMWLLILTAFGILTSSIIAGQAELLDKAIILAAFLPAIVDMGGNSASQVATLVIRSIALQDLKVRIKDVFLVLKKEIVIACMLAVVVAVAEVVMAHFTKSPGGDILLVVGVSMFACTLTGSVIGAILPFVAKKFGADPATLSSPMLTSICDFVGVLIYLGFAMVILGGNLM
ncbi:magnesium transporter [Chromobacterium sp. IIBBL 290-4]|uniref:magnesium transporter n=1 Tax=Chromobacterium sp. IIBBL 290-4 TaxID=2953890 RepID=UPI0020B88A31|nr:magnesium transporter [Chromobacterium sp. IIBBL 290-4]UTH76347.1 magnesium transporter [Chromobacterium sp. IIBBL 290-4]